ncbi:MAG: methylenetetrahydrofolate reductase [Candidatus Muirbacterium halophilum]|nr:methylenetetrahydrofolate reductase [Candidatus Muirbacterium halophilum]MCK9474954.1 methylenetetrahydrofolate reductase [Candidatus Muirbacterium halophilum]
MSILKEIILSGKKVLTAELFAPKGIDMTLISKKVELLKHYIHAFNVTDNQRATMRVSSLGLCAWIQNNFNVETVFQLNCRDRNRIALQSDLLAASLLGIKNVLVITGDHPSVGDHDFAKAVYDMDSVQLLHTISGLKKGVDFSGNELKGNPDIFVGATANPAARPLRPHLIKFGKKVHAGAEFFQTQVVFDTDKYIEFAKQANEYNIPIIAGISLIKNVKFAHFINKSVPGLNVPEETIKRLSQSEDYKEERVKIACEIIEKLKPYVAGFHFMAFGLEREIPQIIEKTKI